MKTCSALLLLGFWMTALAQPDVLPVLQEAQHHVRQAVGTEGTSRRQHLREAAQKLYRIPQRVREPLAGALKEAQSIPHAKEQTRELQQVLRQMDTYRDVMEWRSPSPLDASRTAKQLETIFNSPDMQPPPKTFIQRFFEWMGRGLESLFDALGRLFGGVRAGGASSWLSKYGQWIVIGALILLAALGGAYVLNRVEWKRGRRAKTVVDVETIEDARVLTGDEWRQTALQLAAQGEHRLAIRAVYLGILRTLDQNGFLHYDPTLTNWEHLANLRSGAHPRLYDTLQPVTTRFDTVWYGERHAGANDFQQFLEVYDSLVRQGSPMPKPAGGG